MLSYTQNMLINYRYIFNTGKNYRKGHSSPYPIRLRGYSAPPFMRKKRKKRHRLCVYYTFFAPPFMRG